VYDEQWHELLPVELFVSFVIDASISEGFKPVFK